MSEIGIDFGNDSCYIAVAKGGVIETIVNDDGLRYTPSCVAFSQKKRLLGTAAKNQMVTNLKNTVFDFKRLLGRKFSDPRIQANLKHLPFKLESGHAKGIGIRVNYRGEENVYSPEQITAMLLTKLKDTAAKVLDTPVESCVISVPSHFTNAERNALLDAAKIAGLNVRCLFNETTATALAYGYYKNDLPAPEEKPQIVVFVDLGHSSLQVTACAFNQGKLQVLATSTNHECGGRDIDIALAEHFCQEFKSKTNIDATKNQRAYLRLLQEVEKLKKQMSANSTRLPFYVECFMQDLDVSSDMQRSKMEQICSWIFDQVEKTLRNVKRNANLTSEDIHSVEVVGGSTRIPAVKALIEQVFGKQASTTLNQDEAVSRGCALQCALLSPHKRMRWIEVLTGPSSEEPRAPPGGSEGTLRLTGHELKRCIEAEAKMRASDQRERDRDDARNALEEYVYELGSKLGSSAAASGSNGGLQQLLNLTANWLNEETEHQDIRVYIDKLAELRKRGELIHLRPGTGTEDSLFNLAKKPMKSPKGQAPYKSDYRRDDKFSIFPDLDQEMEDLRTSKDVPKDGITRTENEHSASASGYNNVTPSTDNNCLNERDIRYFAELKLLNRSALDYMNKNVEQNPYFDLSPTFKEYEQYLKGISDKRTSN